MTKKHTIRIVGGEYRRTPIPVIEGTGLRPTPDRVRETLYNWLQHLWGGNFTDKHVLDLFAGSGALGFEAASRGAAHVQMAENNHEAVLALRALRTKLRASNVRIHEGDALAAVSHLNASPFDLVLLDPPFGQGWLDKLWTPLVRVLNPTHGLIYIESETPVTPPASFEIIRKGKAGNVHFHLIQFAALQKIDNNLPIPK